MALSNGYHYYYYYGYHYYYYYCCDITGFRVMAQARALGGVTKDYM